jgi:hypothetical protein
MKYKITWTENVGYEAIVEGADSPEQALEWFQDDAGEWNPQSTDYCEIEQDSIEVEPYFDSKEQLSELCFKLRTVLPHLEATRDEGGQIVIYTGLKLTDQGNLIEHEPE